MSTGKHKPRSSPSSAGPDKPGQDSGSGPTNPSSTDYATAEDQQQRDWRALHIWQFQPVRDVLVVLLVVMLFWLGGKLSVVTVPVLLALGLAYLFEPVVRRMTRVRWVSRQGAVSAIIVAAVLLVVLPLGFGAAYGVVQAVDFGEGLVRNVEKTTQAAREPDRRKFNELREDLPSEAWRYIADEYRGWMRSTEEGRKQLGIAPDGSRLNNQQDPDNPNTNGAADEDDDDARPGTSLIVRAVDFIRDNPAVFGTSALQSAPLALKAVLSTLGSVLLLGFTIFLTAFFFFFFSISYPKVLEFARKLIPDKHKDQTAHLAKRMDVVVNGFIRGRVTIAIIQCIVLCLGYWMIGVPAAFTLGIIVGLLSIVPYVALIGIPVAILLMFLDPPAAEGFMSEWWWLVIAPIAVYMIAQALDDYVLTPMIQGDATGMDTPMILFASLAGGALAGFFGVLLAIPVAACLKILIIELFWPRFKEWVQGKRSDFLPLS